MLQPLTTPEAYADSVCRDLELPAALFRAPLIHEVKLNAAAARAALLRPQAQAPIPTSEPASEPSPAPERMAHPLLALDERPAVLPAVPEESGGARLQPLAEGGGGDLEGGGGGASVAVKREAGAPPAGGSFRRVRLRQAA